MAETLRVRDDEPKVPLDELPEGLTVVVLLDATPELSLLLRSELVEATDLVEVATQ